MAQTNSWIKVFRRAIKVSVGTGLTVQPDRGNILVLYGTNSTGFISINLPYKWQQDQWVEALKLIKTAADTYQNYKSNISFKPLLISPRKQHLNSSYSRFNTKDLENAFDCYSESVAFKY